MSDILRGFYADVRCDRCGDFTVGADVVAESQRLLAEGCPGSQFECPPELLTELLEPTVLESLKRAGCGPENANEIVVLQVTRGHALRVAVRPVPDTRNLSRWDDDGGYVPTPPRSDSC